MKKHLRRITAFASGAAAALFFCAQTAFAALQVEELVPMGDIVGIDIRMEGAVVIDVIGVSSGTEEVMPARDAGILPGDVITQVGTKAIQSAEDIQASMAAADGSPVSVRINRAGKTLQLTLEPCRNGDGTYEMGVWLRDTMAGMGTLTFYDPQSGTFAALGHAISDMDTGVLVPVREGNISQADVTNIVTGQPGNPGQLQGVFDMTAPIGTIESNTEQGIFGHIRTGNITAGRAALPVAERSEIELGSAEILSAIDGELKTYAIEVTRVYSGSEAGNRSMMITVTDPALLSMSGGIVQGMSGSPIVQNGKLIGAVTHVLINNPAKGYGISAEDMLNAVYSGANTLAA